MNPNDIAPMLMAIVLVLTIGTVVILRGALGKPFARRLEERLDFAERLLSAAPERQKDSAR